MAQLRKNIEWTKKLQSKKVQTFFELTRKLQSKKVKKYRMDMIFFFLNLRTKLVEICVSGRIIYKSQILNKKFTVIQNISLIINITIIYVNFIPDFVSSGVVSI